MRKTRKAIWFGHVRTEKIRLQKIAMNEEIQLKFENNKTPKRIVNNISRSQNV